jgi:2-methylisocitrate lyase-like PEP mutase family enzyme
MNQSHAATFRALHEPGQILILPNAWDAGSARLIETCGAPAIATSSAAVAWACGYPDGDALPVRQLAAVVESIARVIDVPLSVDSEAGYSSDPARVTETIFAVASAGGVGVNLEDGTDAPDLLCAKIDAARRGARKAGIDLFVNARIDVLLNGLTPLDKAMDAVLSRAALYRSAGCDGIFVPLLAKPDEIRTVVAAIDPLPLNVLAVPGLAAAAELKKLGVRRLSAGAGIARASISLSKRLAEAFLKDGRSDDIYREVTEQTDLNALFPRA